MIELAQHIEALLLENDCVIVPGLGGFVAHYTPSTRVEKEQLFLPPTRMVGFNPQLKMNDGLLVQSYMTVYDTCFSDASKMVDKKVNELLDILHENGKAVLPNIGELSYSIHNTYDFVPHDHKTATPYLYGLCSFEMQELSVLKTPVERKIVPVLPTITERKRTFEIRPDYSYLSRIAAMIAVIILCFCLSTPVKNTEVIKGNYAQLLPEELFEQIGKQSLTMTSVIVNQSSKKSIHTQPVSKEKSVKPVAVKEVKVAKPATQTIQTAIPEKASQKAVATPTATSESKTIQEKTITPQKPVTAVSKRYHIIVASVGQPEDAKNMAKMLVQKGFKGAQAIIGDGKNRVGIGSYATETEAYQVLDEIRRNEAYQQAWVLKK